VRRDSRPGAGLESLLVKNLFDFPGCDTFVDCIRESSNIFPKQEMRATLFYELAGITDRLIPSLTKTVRILSKTGYARNAVSSIRFTSIDARRLVTFIL
jgi:hypothetical protein